MTSSVIHKMAAITSRVFLPPSTGYFLASRTTTFATTLNTGHNVEMDDILVNPDGLLDSTGTFIVPSFMNGYYAHLSVSMQMSGDARFAVGVTVSTDNGASYSTGSILISYKNSNVLQASKLIQLTGGYRYRAYVFCSNIATVVQVSPLTYFEGYI